MFIKFGFLVKGILLFICVFIYSCSALPVKELQFAQSSLEKANGYQAQELQKDEYQEAQKFYQEAQKAYESKNAEQVVINAGLSIEKSRFASVNARVGKWEKENESLALILKDFLMLDDGDLNPDMELELKAQMKLELVKNLKIVQEKKAQAEGQKDNAVQVIAKIKPNIQKAESLKEEDEFNELMNQAFATLGESRKLLNEQRKAKAEEYLDRLKKIRLKLEKKNSKKSSGTSVTRNEALVFTQEISFIHFAKEAGSVDVKELEENALKAYDEGDYDKVILLSKQGMEFGKTALSAKEYREIFAQNNLPQKNEKKSVKSYKKRKSGPKFLNYEVKYGDYLWKIAQEIYGSGEMWIVIWNENKRLVADPEQIIAGTTIKLPVNKKMILKKHKKERKK
jgi:nucleoid-associated protein YgaU